MCENCEIGLIFRVSNNSLLKKRILCNFPIKYIFYLSSLQSPESLSKLPLCESCLLITFRLSSNDSSSSNNVIIASLNWTLLSSISVKVKVSSSWIRLPFSHGMAVPEPEPKARNRSIVNKPKTRNGPVTALLAKGLAGLKTEATVYSLKWLFANRDYRFFSAWICTSICPKREFGQKAVRFQIPVFYLESYRFLPSTLKGCQHGPWGGCCTLNNLTITSSLILI